MNDDSLLIRPTRCGREKRWTPKRSGNYLKEELSGLDGPVTVRQFHSGFSNLTYLITVGETELVLRRPPIGKKARTAHDMNREYRILSALKPVFPYVPAPLALL
jgi:aminoglycoside phosphotransferase (APT) family kinase protein